MGGKSGTTAAGSTALRMAHGPSTSQNDSQDSIGAAASQSQSQINLTAGATTTTHSTINCKHLPNRQTFLRVYYDAIRAIETGNYLRLCEMCGSGGSPLYACLQCVHFSCCRPADHYTQHNTDSGHALSVEVSTGVLRCIVCRVFIWNEDLERVHLAARQGVLPGFLCRSTAGNLDDDLDARIFSKHCIGVRGLHNLGNTCFMNSVLQPLLHLPELIRHQLSYAPGTHRKSACSVSQAGNPCVACEMDSLIARFYNGNKKPICPSDLLHAVWRSAAEMSGYEQQDAHEFFLCLRSGLHRALGGAQYNCNCIVHRLFAGVLQSDVSCPVCHGRTETYDPFLDISLDLLHHGDYMTSVEDCLEHFTRTEAVPMDSYTCSHCGQGVADVYKRMSIRAAPRTLVVHLKRFESGAASVKIDKHVSFPMRLDLHRYTPDYREEEEADSDTQDQAFDIVGVSGNEAPGGPHYQLLSVVSHIGSLDSGHYTCYQRYQDQWFHIDDALVTLTTEPEVLNAQAYMLFYGALTMPST